MPLKIIFKIWYSLNWRVILYTLTVYFYLMSLFSLIVMFCLNNNLIENCRNVIFNLFNLSDTAEIPIFSYWRVIVSESLGALISFPLIFIALKRLTRISFNSFSIQYQSIKRTFLIIGPGAFLAYLFIYIIACGYMGRENESLQGMLSIAIPFVLTPFAFKKDIQPI